VSPTVFRSGNRRFYFCSRKEERVHVHVVSPDGEANFWLEPVIALATHTGFTKTQLRELQQPVEDHEHEIITAWDKHFTP